MTGPYRDFGYWCEQVKQLGLPARTAEDLDWAIVLVYRREGSLRKAAACLGEPRRSRGGANNIQSYEHLRITFRGRTQWLREWARETGLGYKLIYNRITRKGWTPEEALMLPALPYGKRRESWKNKKQHSPAGISRKS